MSISWNEKNELDIDAPVNFLINENGESKLTKSISTIHEQIPKYRENTFLVGGLTGSDFNNKISINMIDKNNKYTQVIPSKSSKKFWYTYLSIPTIDTEFIENEDKLTYSEPKPIPAGVLPRGWSTGPYNLSGYYAKEDEEGVKEKVEVPTLFIYASRENEKLSQIDLHLEIQIGLLKKEETKEEDPEAGGTGAGDDEESGTAGIAETGKTEVEENGEEKQEEEVVEHEVPYIVGKKIDISQIYQDRTGTKETVKGDDGEDEEVEIGVDSEFIKNIGEKFSDWRILKNIFIEIRLDSMKYHPGKSLPTDVKNNITSTQYFVVKPMFHYSETMGPNEYSTPSDAFWIAASITPFYNYNRFSFKFIAIADEDNYYDDLVVRIGRTHSTGRITKKYLYFETNNDEDEEEEEEEINEGDENGDGDTENPVVGETEKQENE